MTTILGYVSSVFDAMFGASGYVASVISLVVAQPYLMVGLALMVTGAAVSYLARLIHNT